MLGPSCGGSLSFKQNSGSVSNAPGGNKTLPSINENVVLPNQGGCENKEPGMKKRQSIAGVLTSSTLLLDRLLKTSPHGRSCRSTKSLLGEKGRNLGDDSKNPGFDYGSSLGHNRK